MRKVLFFLLGCFLAGCSHFAPEPSDSDLVFPDLASVWDEATPLGNATVGEMIWQRDEQLRLSLDRIDLWDLRPRDLIHGDHYSFDWIRARLRNGEYDEIPKKFKNTHPAPSKIPGAALEIDMSGWGPVQESRLYLKDALCQIDWQNGVRLRTFVQAGAPVGWLIFDNVPESVDFQLIPPEYSGEGEIPSGSLRKLGYPQGDIRREGNRITYHQCGYDGFFYDSEGKLAAFDTDLTQQVNSVVVRKDILDAFLEKTGMKLVWIVQAEKEIHVEDYSIAYWSEGEAVFTYEREGNSGEIKQLRKQR